MFRIGSRFEGFLGEDHRDGRDLKVKKTCNGTEREEGETVRRSQYEQRERWGTGVGGTRRFEGGVRVGGTLVMVQGR